MCALRLTKGRDKKKKKIKSGPTSRAKAAQQHIHLSFSRKENANFYTPSFLFSVFFFSQQKKRKSSTTFNSTLLYNFAARPIRHEEFKLLLPTYYSSLKLYLCFKSVLNVISIDIYT